MKFSIDRVAITGQQFFDNVSEYRRRVNPRELDVVTVAHWENSASNPDWSHAIIPPLTFAAWTPTDAMNSQAIALRPPDLQMTYTGPAPIDPTVSASVD